MKNKNWNSNDWQGRSKKNVETSYKLTFYSIVGMIVTLIIASLIS